MKSLFHLRDEGKGKLRNTPLFRGVFAFSLLLVILEVAFISWRVLPLIYGDTAAPLHYNTHFGVDTIGAWWRVYTAPGLGLLFLLMNGMLAEYFASRERVLSMIALGATILLEGVLFVATVFIILLNISYG